MTFKLIVICGPSGTGKSTLLKLLFDQYPTIFGFSVSHTSRKPRQGEKNGIEYHFVSREVMKLMIDAGEFIESAEFSGNLYGTSFQAVGQVIDIEQKNVILDIDMQGVIQLRQHERENRSRFDDVLFIFLAPPSIGELERRLRGRGTENAADMQARIDVAEKEIEWGTRDGNCDYVIVNHDVTSTYDQLTTILKLKDILK